MRDSEKSSVYIWVLWYIWYDNSNDIWQAAK